MIRSMFLGVCWPFVYFLLRNAFLNVYWNLLQMFKRGCLSCCCWVVIFTYSGYSPLGRMIYKYYSQRYSSFPHWMVLDPLRKINWPKMYKFSSGLSVQFHWSRSLSLYQYHDVLITVDLQQVLKTVRTFYFLVAVVFAMWGP